MRTIDARVEAEGKASKKDYPEAPAVGTERTDYGTTSCKSFRKPDCDEVLSSQR